MEALGAAASILAIAGAGVSISIKLITFADQVGTAPKRIRAVGTDVSVTAGTLQQLGELMEKTPKKNSTGMFWPDQVRNIRASSNECKEIFDQLEAIFCGASQQLREVYKRDKSSAKSLATPPKIKLSRMERLKWPFLQPSIEPLQSALRDAKGTLTLILQVVHLRHAQVTASLDWEEQNDLVRMIAAMRRQQLASSHVGNGGYKGLDAGGAEDSDSDSDSEDSSKIFTALEAWSVAPNTFSDDTFRHFSITPVPVSQQQIAKSVSQDVDEVASMIDSLSPPEQEAILEDRRLFGSDGCSIRSITAQSWTGSHDLFGKVSGRKFNVIIERKVGIPKSSRTKMRRGHRKEHASRSHVLNSSDSNPARYDSFSDNDSFHDRGSSPSPPSRVHGRRSHAKAHPRHPSERHSARASRPAEFERRRPARDSDSERRQASVERKRLVEKMLRMEAMEKKPSLNSKQHTKPQGVHEPSDDELVKSLLTEYTNFDPGEPLVQGFATPPPTYYDSFVLPQRESRPY